MTQIYPIEGILIHEPIVRVVASLVAITATIGIYLQSPLIFLFLAFDFFVRGFDKKELSLFRFIGIKTIAIIDIKEKLIDSGGKKFASKVGFLLSVVLTVSAFLHLSFIVLAIGGILVLFAALESAFAFCIGCKIYTLYARLF